MQTRQHFGQHRRCTGTPIVKQDDVSRLRRGLVKVVEDFVRAPIHRIVRAPETSEGVGPERNSSTPSYHIPQQLG